MKVVLRGGHFDCTVIDIDHPMEIIVMALPPKVNTSINRFDPQVDKVEFKTEEYRIKHTLTAYLVYEII